MKHIDDEKLLMVLLGEASQEETDTVLQSEQACEQLDQLEADMQAINNASSEHHLPDDYGQKLWSKIADQLEAPIVDEISSPNWIQKLFGIFMQPQFSIASMALVAALVMVAFYAGKQHQGDAFSGQIQEQLLAQNIKLHLTQSEIFLTQVSNNNSNNSPFNNQQTAQRLLASNRIFKQALVNYDGQFTQQVLKNLEPVLLEYANNSTNQIHGQQPQAKWVNNTQPNDLLFQIKAMKQQLAQKNDII